MSATPLPNPILIEKGEDFAIQLTLRDPQTKVGINLTGADVSCAMNKLYDTSAGSVNLTCALLDAPNGVIKISLTKEQVDNLESQKQYFFNVNMTLSSVDYKLIKGSFYIGPSVVPA